MDSPALWLAAMAALALASIGLLPAAVSRRTRLLALAAALLIAPLLIVADNWDSAQITRLRESPALLAAGLIAGAAALAVLTAIFVRRPRLLPLAVVATIPIRIPITLGGSDANLLVPLYAVIASGLVAAWISSARGEAAGAGDREPPGLLRWLGLALAGYLLVYGLQAGYADSLSPAVQNIAFFFIPFAVLFALLSGVEWDRRLIETGIWLVAIEALLFALVAFGQYVTGELFWNDKVIAGNEAHAWFRVNSLFWDPNIFGRYLAVVMTLLAAVVAFARDRATTLRAAVAFAVLLAALAITFSQSSLIALIAGILVVAAVRWGLGRALAAAALAAAGLLASVALVSGGGLTTDTSGRNGLISGGLELAEDRPVQGYGSGSFAAEFRERFGAGDGIAIASHTEPVTVLTEQGAIGMVPYLALIVISVVGLIVASGVSWRGSPPGAPIAGALLAAYAAMLVHSVGYAAFMTDPITWALLALAIAAIGPAPARVPARAAPA